LCEERCEDNGFLSGGTIDVSPDPPCPNTTITFTVSDVVDSGGVKAINCSKEPIAPVAPTYTWTLTIPPDYPPPLPPLSGTGPVATVVVNAPGTYSVTFTATANRECPPAPITIGPESVDVPDVISVAWEEYLPESTPLDVCRNNGGKRIFPDRRYAVDPSANIRSKVTLKATLSQPVEGCALQFRTWDVDDPFDQNNSGMPGVQVIDSDAAGPDNRGTDPGVISGTAPTDAAGEARFTVTMSMQPGNNYRGTASGFADAINGVTQSDADANMPPARVKFTEMLTVWRRLHVELDSMAAGSDASTLANRNLDDTGLEENHQIASGGHGWAEINNWNAQVQNGRLEGGTLTVTGGGTYVIVDNIDDTGDDSVYVEGSTLADEDKLATATDDDAPFVPRKADISLMSAKFKPAYIAIEEHPEESQLDIPFDANLSNEAVPVVNTTAPGRGAAFLTAADFWAVQVVSCFQSTTDADHDPDRIYHFWSGIDHKDGDGSRFGDTPPDDPTIYDNVSVIFLESIRDWADWTQTIGNLFTKWPAEDAQDIERVTVVHEVGHVFLGSAHPVAGIMKLGASDPQLEFRAEDLLEIRTGQRVGSP
jgi:hypothetical protein